MIAPRRLVHLPGVARDTIPARSSARRRSAAVAASVVVHALVLAVLGWRAAPRLAPAATDREPPAVVLTLVRPSPSPASSRPAASRAADSPPPLSALPRPTTAIPLPVPSPTPAPPAAPAAPAAGSGTGVHPGPLPGAEAGGDFRGFLRAGVGCAHRDGVGLTRLEREACDRKAGEVAKAAPTMDRIPAEKRAYYDAVAAAYAAMRYETPVVRTPVVGGDMYADPPTAMPGRMPGVGCRIAFGKPRGWKASKSGPAHSLELGPCVVSPPQGVLTEEADIKPPPSLREREADAKAMRDLDPPTPSTAKVTPPGR